MGQPTRYITPDDLQAAVVADVDANDSFIFFDADEPVVAARTKRITLGTLKQWMFAGAFTLNAPTMTSPVTIDGLAYTFPQDQIAQSYLANDGAGNLEWAAKDWYTTDVADASFAPISHTHPWTDITGKPTTIGGYGITNAYTQAQVDTLLAAKVFGDHGYVAGDVLYGQVGGALAIRNLRAGTNVTITENAGAGTLTIGAPAFAWGSLTGTPTTVQGYGITNAFRTDAVNVGDLLFTDATYDIGKTGATRPRDLFLSRNATVGGTLSAGNTSVGTLHATGGATLDGALSVGGNLSVTGAAAFGNVAIGGTLAVSSLASTGPLTIAAGLVNAAQYPLMISAEWNTPAGVFTGFLMDIANTASDISSYLMRVRVDGVDRMTLSRAGNFAVLGSGSFGGTLQAAATTVTTLHATGAATLDSTLSALATTVTTLHTTGATTHDTTMSVAGLSTLTGGARLDSTLDWTTNNASDIGSALHKPRDLFLGRNADIVGTLHVGGASTLDGTLGVTGAVTGASFSGDGSALTALNATQLTSGTVPNARLTGAYTGVTGLGTLAADLLFTDATYDIGKSGATRPRDLFLSRNAVVGGTLTVTGNATLSGTSNNVGTVTTGVWNGTAVITTYGGTGLTAYTAGDLPYYSAGTTLSKLAIGAAGKMLRTNGAAPLWSTATYPDDVAAGDILIATAGSTVGSLVIGAANRVLTSSGAAPQWSANIVYAVLPTGNGSWDAGVGNTTTFTRAVTITGAFSNAGAATFTGVTDSSNTATGIVVISGGVGIAKKMFVGDRASIVSSNNGSTAALFVESTDNATGGYGLAIRTAAGGSGQSAFYVITNHATSDITALDVRNDGTAFYGGHQKAGTDATFDIGAAGANRFRDLFLSRNALIGGTLGVSGTTTLAALATTTIAPSGTITSTASGVTLARSGGVRLGEGSAVYLVAGASGSGYPVVGYNINTTGTTNVYTNVANDTVSAIDFGSKTLAGSSLLLSFLVSGTPGAGGSTVTFTTAGGIDSSGNWRFGGHVLNGTDNTYDLGDNTRKFRDLYLGRNAVVGGTLGVTGNVTLSGTSNSVGTITTGVWNGTVVVTTYGGTGLASYTAGDTLYYASGTALTKLAIGSANAIMQVSGGAPSWTLTPAGLTSIGATTGTFTNVAGTLSTAAQPNVTSLGTLTSLSSGAITTTGNLTITKATPVLTFTNTASGNKQWQLFGSGNNFFIEDTGTGNALQLTAGGGAVFAGGAFTLNGNLVWNTDNAQDIGASGANRPRDLFLSRNATIGGNLTAATGALSVTGSSSQSSGGTTTTHFLSTSNSSAYALAVINSHASNPFGIAISFSGADPNGAGNAFWDAYGSGTTLRGQLRSNGGIANYSANNVNLSDERTKTFFGSVDGAAMADLFRAIDVQKFKYRDQTHKDFNIGFGAQTFYKAAQKSVPGLADSLVDQEGWESDGKTYMAMYETDLAHAHIAVTQYLLKEVDALKAPMGRNADYVLEAIFNGTVSDFLEQPGANTFAAEFKRRGNKIRTLDEMKRYAKQHLHLPGIVESQGVKERSNALLEHAELTYAYLWQQQDEIVDLRREVNELRAQLDRRQPSSRK